MQTRTTYKGTLDGVYGVWCGFKPKKAKIEEEILVYYPESGKALKKDDKFYDFVILKEGETIEEYVEVDAPEDVLEEGPEKIDMD